MSKILVIGSSNMDLIARVDNFPRVGETISGLSYSQSIGGKGGNQALAAHRLGGDVMFVTSLGNDINGQSIQKYYRGENLNISLSLISPEVSWGVAMIWVNSRGDNSIVVISGANNRLSSDYIYEIKSNILEADLIVLQMEIPYETVKYICDLAHKHNKKIMLNVAPAIKLDRDIIEKVDVLVVNETEAEVIIGEKIKDLGEREMIDRLLSLGSKAVVLTLGDKGSIIKNSAIYRYIPAYSVNTVDTTSAGDTFCGALAAELSRGSSWLVALEFATAASALCVMQLGAQSSIPYEKDVRSFLSNNK